MGLTLYPLPEEKRPYCEYPSPVDWGKCIGSRCEAIGDFVIDITYFMRFCIAIMEGLSQIKKHSQDKDLDRKELLAVLDCHLEVICKTLDTYLTKIKWAQQPPGTDRDCIERDNYFKCFTQELQGFQRLLDNQFSRNQSNNKPPISRWSSVQLLLCVIFMETDKDWTFCECNYLRKD